MVGVAKIHFQPGLAINAAAPFLLAVDGYVIEQGNGASVFGLLSRKDALEGQTPLGRLLRVLLWPHNRGRGGKSSAVGSLCGKYLLLVLGPRAGETVPMAAPRSAARREFDFKPSQLSRSSTALDSERPSGGVLDGGFAGDEPWGIAWKRPFEIGRIEPAEPGCVRRARADRSHRVTSAARVRDRDRPVPPGPEVDAELSAVCS